MGVSAIRRGGATARMIRAGAVLALAGVLAACEGGYTEATSPCVGATAMAFHAGSGTTSGAGVEAVTRRAGDPCAFTAVGDP